MAAAWDAERAYNWTGRGILWGIHGIRLGAKQLVEDASKIVKARALTFEPWPSDGQKNDMLFAAWNAAVNGNNVEDETFKVPSDSEARRVKLALLIDNPNPDHAND
jgi:hypothetical protein